MSNAEAAQPVVNPEPVDVPAFAQTLPEVARVAPLGNDDAVVTTAGAAGGNGDQAESSAAEGGRSVAGQKEKEDGLTNKGESDGNGRRKKKKKPLQKTLEMVSTMVAVNLFVPPKKDRSHEDPSGFTRLVANIKQNGILQAILAREVKGGKYDAIAGKRRLRAAIEAGFTEVPCRVVRGKPQQGQDALIALSENACREEMSPLDQARLAKTIIDETDCTQEALATEWGVSPGTVSEYLKLLERWKDLTDDQREKLESGELSAKFVLRSLGKPTATTNPSTGEDQGTVRAAKGTPKGGNDTKDPKFRYAALSWTDSDTKITFLVCGNNKKAPPTENVIRSLQKRIDLLTRWQEQHKHK